MTSSAKPKRFRHVAIVGPGAIGLCLAVRLARSKAGCRVTLIDARPGGAERLSGGPLRLHGPEGDLEADVPVRASPEGPVDLVILATKAHQARDAVAAAAAWVGETPLVALQNGLGVPAEVAEALPAANVVTGVSYQAANRLGDREVHHVANLMTHVGYEGRRPDAVVEAVAALLNEAGLPARAEADMTPVVWGKLLVNAAINPVAALAGVRNGEVAARPALAAMATAVAEEGEATARAEGVTLPYTSAVEAAMATARNTADNRCSMLQDLEAGRQSEIEYLNARIVGVAAAHAIETPANRALVALVRQVSTVQQREPSGG